jgi:hypothetical protein
MDNNPQAIGFSVEELTQMEVALIFYIEKLTRNTKRNRNLTATLGVSIYADLLSKVQAAIKNLEFRKD